MPNREFLEKYPLYRKFKFASDPKKNWDQPAVHMACPVCGSEQTFNMANDYYEGVTQIETYKDLAFRLVYQCSSCKSFCRYFFIRFNRAENYLMKVGQEPAWDIALNQTIAKSLGAQVDYYKKALICESQGYGIGAFAYYRRMVEELIDALLANIPELMTDTEKEKYREAFEQTKKTKVTENKIDLVKDLLPPILRPNEMNPLAALHSALRACEFIVCPLSRAAG